MTGSQRSQVNDVRRENSPEGRRRPTAPAKIPACILPAARWGTELCNPAHDHRRIYEIAFALGFSSEAPVDRVFRSTFGLSPSDVRGRAQATRVDASRPEPADIANGGYEEWARQLK